MRHTILKSIIAAAGIAGSLLVSGTASAETVIRLMSPPTIGMLPTFVAQEKGYFKKRDIRVDHTFGFNLAAMVPAVLSAQTDIALTDTFIILNATDAGIELAVLGSNAVTNGAASGLNTIVVLKESPLKSAADLVGKRVAVSGVNTHFHILAAHWLKQNGVDPSKVTWVELGFPQVADALKSGQIDAGTTAPPFNFRISTTLGRILYNFDSMLPVHSLTGVWISTPAWAQKNKAAVDGWRAAIEEAHEWIAKNEPESREILSRNLKVPPEVYAGVPYPVFRTKMVPAQIDTYLNIARGQNLIKTNVNTAKLIFP